MLLGSEWNASTPLVDPMCGSGTIPIEAALIARGAAPGQHRRFAFENWKSFDQNAWSQMKSDALAATRSSAGVTIIGSDRDAGAIEAARSNAERAGVLSDIDFSVRPISAVSIPDGPGLMLSNPPYGDRIGDVDRLRNLYSSIGLVLPPEYRVGLLSADRRLEGHVGVGFREIFRTSNGGIPVRFVLSE
jgi:putative N6-adenine-specific DNA methylase